MNLTSSQTREIQKQLTLFLDLPVSRLSEIENTLADVIFLRIAHAWLGCAEVWIHQILEDPSTDVPD